MATLFFTLILINNVYLFICLIIPADCVSLLILFSSSFSAMDLSRPLEGPSPIPPKQKGRRKKQPLQSKPLERKPKKKAPHDKEVEEGKHITTILIYVFLHSVPSQNNLLKRIYSKCMFFKRIF